MISTQLYAGKKVNVNIALYPELRKKADQKVKEMRLRSLSELIGILLEQNFQDDKLGQPYFPHYIENGRVFLLVPIDENHNDWRASTVKKSILVLAEDERLARKYAAKQTGILAPIIPNCQTPLDPWMQPERATARDVTDDYPHLKSGSVGIISQIAEFLTTVISHNKMMTETLTSMGKTIEDIKNLRKRAQREMPPQALPPPAKPEAKHQ